MEMQMTKFPLTPDEMREALYEGTYKIIFEKLDGTERTLVGTTKFEAIPEEFRPKGSKPKNDSAVPVFDTEIGEWRSFNPAKVKSFTRV
jgi:hypothetical protein